jgi:SAM-dependent methyltransferase
MKATPPPASAPPSDGHPISTHFNFYHEVLCDALERELLRRDSSILVVCGGPNDRDVFHALGFTNVTISNVDERWKEAGNMFHPYQWRFQHADRLEFQENAFDVVVVHSGLHHLPVPVKGLTEMYRVARHLVIGFEPHDCWFTRLGVQLGFGQEYETVAVYDNECRYGGVDNSEIPNYVFRFDSRLIRQAVQCFDPTCRPVFHFQYRTRVPGRLFMMRNRLYAGLGRLAGLFLHRVGRWPGLANNIAFVIEKPAPGNKLHPWLTWDGEQAHIDREYLENLYRS